MKKYIFVTALLGIVSLQVIAQTITPQEAAKHIGEKQTICGKIFGGRFFEKSDNPKTLLNMGGAYPNHLITIVIEGDTRKKFTVKPEEFYANKEVCVTGEIKDFKGKPELHVTEVAQIKLAEPVKQ